jgi:hypothetical protein
VLLGGDYSVIRGASRSGDSIALRPSDGFAGVIGISRRLGRWELDLESGYQASHVQALSPTISVQQRREHLDRYRLQLLAGRMLGRIGTGTVALLAGPVVENWTADGEDGRSDVGLSARLALRMPLGGVVMEQSLGFEWIDGPFDQAELPAGYEKRALRVLSLGTRLRIRL